MQLRPPIRYIYFYVGWFILYLEYLRYSFTRNLYARYCTQKDADLSIVKDGKFNAYV